MSEIKKQVLSAARYLIRKEQSNQLEEILNIASFDKINNVPIDNLKDIAIVIPALDFNSGGGSSILRIGTSLAKHATNVHYVCYNSNNINKLTNNANKSINNFEGEYLTFEAAKNIKFDVCIATSWQSVYYAKLLSGYKIYFVQDYEPFFYSMSDEYLLAKLTYNFGFHLISLGQWNLKQIHKYNEEIVTKEDYVAFPYEPSEYKYVQRNYLNYKNLKSIKIACYIKSSGRRIPKIILHILKKCNMLLNQKGYELDLYFYGLNKNESVPLGKNLGRLTKKELSELYQHVHFGMVASMTNISLVPYEMIASGLPVIEFNDGSYKEFLGDDTAILIDLDYKEFAEKLMYLLNNPSEIKAMQDRALNRISNLSWSKTCEEFWEILNNYGKN